MLQWNLEYKLVQLTVSNGGTDICEKISNPTEYLIYISYYNH